MVPFSPTGPGIQFGLDEKGGVYMESDLIWGQRSKTH